MGQIFFRHSARKTSCEAGTSQVHVNVDDSKAFARASAKTSSLCAI